MFGDSTYCVPIPVALIAIVDNTLQNKEEGWSISTKSWNFDPLAYSSCDCALSLSKILMLWSH
jgi:hypothetical protein